MRFQDTIEQLILLGKREGGRREEERREEERRDMLWYFHRPCCERAVPELGPGLEGRPD